MEALTEIISDFFNSIGQERTLSVHLAISALPPKADIRFTLRHVCFVPKAAVSNRSKALFLPGAGRDRAKAQDGERLGVRRIKGFQCQFREGDLDRCAEHGHGAEKRQHAALCSEL